MARSRLALTGGGMDRRKHRFDHHRTVRPPVRPDRMRYRPDDYGPSHRRGSGASRRACESDDAVGASRWPCPDRQRACLRGAGYAPNRQHAKLTETGLLSMIRDGRHRYFRRASPKVVDMLDGIVAVALEARPRYRPLSRQARELSSARICYDHLAGRLSVDLTDFLAGHEYIVLGDEAAEITRAGMRFLTDFGVDLSALRSTRRHFCRLCLDWTERRPHIAGAVGGRAHRALL